MLRTGRAGLPRPSRRLLIVQAVDKRDRLPYVPYQQQLEVTLAVIKTTLVVTAVSTLAAQPAFARGWQERRHHRRLQEDVGNVQLVEAKSKPKEKCAQGITGNTDGLTGLQRGMKRAARKMQKAFKGDGSYSVTYSGREAGGFNSYRQREDPNWAGWVGLFLAVAAVVFLKFGKSISWPWGGRSRRDEGGRWVYDRSLGGKKVYVPGGSKSQRPLWGDDLIPASQSDFTAAANALPYKDSVRSDSSSSSGSYGTENGSKRERSQAVIPEWWVPPRFTVYTTPSRQEELQKQAKAVLRELEDSKLQGLDYPLSSLLALRTLCQEGGGLQVKPRTENGRDAMLRTGVRASMESAMEGSRGLLTGVEPARFVSGLAHDLGVPDTRAVTITHAEVAAASRALLIASEAAYRSGDQAEIMLSLVKLAQLLSNFPLPPGSAEAELLAGSIQQQTTMEFRRSVFFTFGYMDPDRAPIVAEMLGFNPELVMPQLLLQLQAAEQAQALQQQESGQEQQHQ